jgi:recombinational DNA repair protein (RecF pathway)
VFKTEAIILSINSIRDNNTRIVCLTKDYGKISLWYKKKHFPYDIGDLIFISIERHWGCNIIKYTESIMSPRETSWTYKKIYLFLENIHLMYTLIPEEYPHEKIFHDYRGLLMHMQSIGNLQEHHYLLFQFRLLRILWYIGKDNFENMPVTRYIYENIISTPLTKLLTARELTVEDARKIEHSNWEAIHKSFI